MWKKAPPADSGKAKEEVRPGAIDAGGELVRDKEPEITVVKAEEQAPAKKAEDKGPTLEERLAGLEKDVKTANAKAAEADQRAREAEERAARSSTTAQTNEDAAFRNHKSAVENASHAIKGELAAAKAAYASAMETGNFTAAADAQEQIAEATARSLNIRAEQGRIEAWEKRPRQEPAQPQQRATTPREAIDLRSMPRAARDYLEEHPELLDDQRLWNKLTRAHLDAVEGEQLDAYGDDYFAFLNRRMGYEGEKKPPSSAGRAQAMPPSRSTPSTTSSRSGGEIQLTARQREIAEFSWPELPPEQAWVNYAEQMVKLEQEGRITRH